jgi:hypothetical protein
MPDYSDVTLGRKNVFPIAAAASLDTSSSNSVITVTGPAAYDITLPTPSYSTMGCNYRFICSANIANQVRIDAGAGLLNSIILSKTNAANTVDITRATAAQYVQLTTAALKNDYVDVYCDGSAWYAYSVSGATTGISTA